MLDHLTQQQPGHRHGHPEPPGDRLDVEFVGLDMPRLDLPSKHPMLVELARVSAGPIAPIGDRSLVEPDGGDDRPDRTAMAEQGDHEGHQIDGLLEAVERSTASGGECVAADGTSMRCSLRLWTAMLPRPSWPRAVQS